MNRSGPSAENRPTGIENGISPERPESDESPGSTTTCSDERLRVLLRDEEDSHDFRVATEHVDACAVCQTRHEKLAADEQLWREAQQMFTSITVDEADAATGRNFTLPQWDRKPMAWTEAMARQLLSPPS